MDRRLILTVEKLGEAGDTLVKFNGEFDKAGHDEIREELGNVINNFKGITLVFDLGELKFINSEGIGYFMSIHAHLVKDGKKLVLVGPNAHVADVFNTIGIMQIMPVFNTMNDFINQK
ncbi:STAS domain-containing protein [Candidatus Gracilibacteria bacterium]|jgi:anti-anti-sigma factor|nr:STAS domain-containing protein [Candidatus Gracilibacteria bacterium]